VPAAVLLYVALQVAPVLSSAFNVCPATFNGRDGDGALCRLEGEVVPELDPPLGALFDTEELPPPQPVSRKNPQRDINTTTTIFIRISFNICTAFHQPGISLMWARENIQYILRT